LIKPTPSCAINQIVEWLLLLDRWLFKVALENGPFIDENDDLPIKNGDFPWLR